MSPFLGVIKVEAVTREWVVLVSPAANNGARGDASKTMSKHV